MASTSQRAPNEASAPRALDPAWVASTAKGLRWGAWAIASYVFLGIAALVAAVIASDTLATPVTLLSSDVIWLLVMVGACVATGLLIAAAWLMSRTPGGAGPVAWSSAWWVRWLLIVAFALALLGVGAEWLLISVEHDPAQATTVTALLIAGLALSVLNYLAIVAWEVATCAHLGRLARQMGDVPLAQLAGRRVWWVLGMNTLGLLLIGLGPMIAFLLVREVMLKTRAMLLTLSAQTPRAATPA